MREAGEEAGIPSKSRWLLLDSKASVARTAFPSATHWPPTLFVVPEHSFAVDATGRDIVLSNEHDEVRWLPFEQAAKLLTWDSNKVALWELNERLKELPDAGRTARQTGSSRRSRASDATRLLLDRSVQEEGIVQRTVPCDSITRAENCAGYGAPQLRHWPV